jgi:hypothetical protein
MEERERWLESGKEGMGGRRREDEGNGVRRDDDSSSGADSDLERGRHEGPRRWSSVSSSSTSELAMRSLGQSRSSASYSEESDLESAPRRRRTRTTSSAFDTDGTDFSSCPSSADDTAASTDDDLSPVRPSTTRRPLPRRGRTAMAEWDQVRAVRHSRRSGRSSEKTRVFG